MKVSLHTHSAGDKGHPDHKHQSHFLTPANSPAHYLPYKNLSTDDNHNRQQDKAGKYQKDMVKKIQKFTDWFDQ